MVALVGSNNLTVIAIRYCKSTVETVGDCYVAAAGIPEPRKDHATAIARFAWDCLECFSKLSKSLEVSLG